MFDCSLNRNRSLGMRGHRCSVFWCCCCYHRRCRALERNYPSNYSAAWFWNELSSPRSCISWGGGGHSAPWHCSSNYSSLKLRLDRTLLGAPPGLSRIPWIGTCSAVSTISLSGFSGALEYFGSSCSCPAGSKFYRCWCRLFGRGDAARGCLHC
jgi:hypothetical protein